MRVLVKSDFIDIWHGELIITGESAKHYERFLTKEEQGKAAQFSRSHLRQKYIKIRAVVRKILSNYLLIQPVEINIKNTEYGKPYLADNDLFFNLSHTDNQFVLAVSDRSELGIDLERKRERNNLSALVNKCFSKAEALYWNALSPEQQEDKFYYFWVRKEAYVKAVGRGLALGLSLCEINPKNQNCFLNVPDNYGVASDWQIHSVPLSTNDYCALVMEVSELKYKLIEFKDISIKELLIKPNFF